MSRQPNILAAARHARDTARAARLAATTTDDDELDADSLAEVYGERITAAELREGDVVAMSSGNRYVVESAKHLTAHHEVVWANTNEGRPYSYGGDESWPLISRAEGETAGPYACAECGTTTATTYVVTILDPKNERDTRTELCRACDDELREEA